MNDKIKDHIIHLILEDKEISGKEKVEILRELFDSPTPCLREHYPQSPYPIYIPSPCPPDTYPPIIYDSGTGGANPCVIDNTTGGLLLGSSDLVFNIHPDN